MGNHGGNKEKRANERVREHQSDMGVRKLILCANDTWILSIRPCTRETIKKRTSQKK